MWMPATQKNILALFSGSKWVGWGFVGSVLTFLTTCFNNWTISLVYSFLSWTQREHVPEKWWYPPALLLTSCMEQSSYLKFTGFSTCQEIPVVWNMKTDSCVDSFLPVSLSWATWIQPTPTCSFSLRSILIFSSHLCQILPHGLFPLGFPTKTLYAFLVCTICAKYLPVTSCWIWWSKCLVWHTNHEAPLSCNATQHHRREGANLGICIFQNLYYC